MLVNKWHVVQGRGGREHCCHRHCIMITSIYHELIGVSCKMSTDLEGVNTPAAFHQHYCVCKKWRGKKNRGKNFSFKTPHPFHLPVFAYIAVGKVYLFKPYICQFRSVCQSILSSSVCDSVYMCMLATLFPSLSETLPPSVHSVTLR